MCIKLRKNRFCGLVSGNEQNFGSQKNKLQTTRELYFLHILGRPQYVDHFEFWREAWHRRIHVKFCVNRLRDFWSRDTPKSGYLRRIGWWLLQQCKHALTCCIVIIIIIEWANTRRCSLPTLRWLTCCRRELYWQGDGHVNHEYELGFISWLVRQWRRMWLRSEL